MTTEPEEKAKATDAAATSTIEEGHHQDQGGLSSPNSNIIFAPSSRAVQNSIHRHEHPMFSEPRHHNTRQRQHSSSNPRRNNNDAAADLMGPLLRRKKVVSMPLGAGGDFFVHEDLGGPHRQLEHLHDSSSRIDDLSAERHQQRSKQLSHDEATARRNKRQTTPPSPGTPGGRHRKKQNSFMNALVRRKQISLDLLGPNDFFAEPEEEEEEYDDDFVEDLTHLPPTTVPEYEELEVGEKPAGEEPEKKKKEKKLFLPLRFSAPLVGHKKRGGGGHGGHGGGGGGNVPTPSAASSALPKIDEETSEALARQSLKNDNLKLQISLLRNKIDEEEDEKKREQLLSVSTQIQKTHEAMEEDHQLLTTKFKTTTDEEYAPDVEKEDKGVDDETHDGEYDKLVKLVDEYEDDGIIRATRSDKIKTAILFVIMLTFTVVVCTWHTHIADGLYIYMPVGLACVTNCPGDVETRDFFGGHNHFHTNQVIELIMHMDPNPEATASDAAAVVEIVGEDTNQVKAVRTLGPVNPELRVSFKEQVPVDFDNPEEHHVINVNSTDPNVELSFTLYAAVKQPLYNYSVLVAALIMILVYAFILVEVIHRTLVAIFGSMLALLFLFIMDGGETVSIAQVMLSMEWSTLGLLFGMMLLVGELSHTGIFEWCAVRLLMASKGSFTRLLVLLCTLTAVASAFLDNVTTMLLVAPVTIDMCKILGVDPRPYLIGEVLLSNVGGTATLIGDPPNIIIGTSYDEIDFVGFIINIMPAIFILILPATLLLVVGIYRHYLTSSKMCVLDTDMLKRTYPIYDQPRLMIAGTTTSFVILIFFLHSVHHKDTAWIALFGAFITMAFTNPHDVQDALRNHVEWDTLLFFAGLFVLVEACAEMGLLAAIGNALASYIESQPEDKQLAIAITLVIWVSAIVSAFLDNIPYTATMIPVIQILADTLGTLPLTTLAWSLSFGACLGGNGTLLGASANIVTAGISKNKGYDISFLNFLYPGMLVMILSVAITNIYMLVRYAWIPVG